MQKNILSVLSLCILGLMLFGCLDLKTEANSKISEDVVGDSYPQDSTPNLLIQQVGETMVSLDESATEIALKNELLDGVDTRCERLNFESCGSSSPSTVKKNFNGCTAASGLLKFSGEVKMVYSGFAASSCKTEKVGDLVRRIPSYTATLVGSDTSFSVSAVSTGQVLTRTGAETFLFSSSGIQQIYLSKGVKYADVETLTKSDISVSGNVRLNRMANGGVLQVINNLTNEVCTVSPKSVVWTSESCPCPTSGELVGKCSTGKDVSLAFTSKCGNISAKYGSLVKTLTIERCY